MLPGVCYWPWVASWVLVVGLGESVLWMSLALSCSMSHFVPLRHIYALDACSGLYFVPELRNDMLVALKFQGSINNQLAN